MNSPVKTFPKSTSRTTLLILFFKVREKYNTKIAGMMFPISKLTSELAKIRLPSGSSRLSWLSSVNIPLVSNHVAMPMHPNSTLPVHPKRGAWFPPHPEPTWSSGSKGAVSSNVSCLRCGIVDGRAHVSAVVIVAAAGAHVNCRHSVWDEGWREGSPVWDEGWREGGPTLLALAH